MKLLENALLDSISAALCMDTGDLKITGRCVCACLCALLYYDIVELTWLWMSSNCVVYILSLSTT